MVCGVRLTFEVPAEVSVMRLRNKVKKLEQRTRSPQDDGRTTVDFGSWLGVIKVPPKTLADLEKIYGKHKAEN